jgi:hypothetical protein
MRRFITTIKKTTDKAFVTESNYLTKMSHAHANNSYNDDDKAIVQSLQHQKLNTNVKLDNEWFSAKSEIHAFTGVQDEDKEIIKSINKPFANIGC